MATIVNGTLMVPSSSNGTLIAVGSCTPQLCSTTWGQLRYVPSLAGNLTYLTIFGLLLLAHLLMGLRFRTWGFLTGITCGLVLQIVGYIGRLGLHGDIFSFNYFVISLVCLTISPAFISASIYLCVSRLAAVYGADVARFSPKQYTLGFVCCDIVSLGLQAAGGALAAIGGAGSVERSTGVDVMIAGLAFQVVSLTVCLVVIADLVIAVGRAPKNQFDHYCAELRSKASFRHFPTVLITATLFIFVRCCFRVAELKDGFDGALANDQTMFMVFEGPMIIVAVLVLAVFHPGTCFGGCQGWKAANWTWRGNKQVE